MSAMESRTAPGTAEQTSAGEPRRLFLRNVACLYAIGLVLHTVDHLRRGIDVLTPEVRWAGNVSTAVGALAVGLVLTHHRSAPRVAALTGFPVALGVAAVHLLPHWSALSDPFAGSRRGEGVTPLSWAVVLIEIAGALAMGVAGAAAVRRGERDRRPAPAA